MLSSALNLALAALGLWLVTGPLRALGWNVWLTASVIFLATVLLGDMAPKFFAARNPSVVLLGSLRLLHPLRNVIDPLASLVDRTTDVLLQRFVTRHIKTRMPVTRDEFETLVEMRPEPVSYTHPDVYKRQALPWATPGALAMGAKETSTC